MEEMERYEEITIKQYAALKHLSPWTVQNLIRRGLLKAQRYGRVWRIRIDAVPEEKPEEKYPKKFTEESFKAMLDAIPIM